MFLVTNEIPDDTIEGQKMSKLEKIEKSEKIGSPQCVICEYIMSQIENELKDKKNEVSLKINIIYRNLIKWLS